jgi:hypothetical protein
VFNPCLELLNKAKHLGYRLKHVNITASHKAFADDATLIGASPKNNQKQIAILQVYTKWSRKLKAKPSKCRHLARKLFQKSPTNSYFIPFEETRYSSFDAKLTIAGEPIMFIGNDRFKFLGRKIAQDLSEKATLKEVLEKFEKHMDTIDKEPLTGFMKLWLYQHYVLSYLAWPFMIYDFPFTAIARAESTANRFIKKWTHTSRPTSTSIFYRSQKYKGLDSFDTLL